MGKKQRIGIYLKKIDILFDSMCNKKLKQFDITNTQFKIIKYLLGNKDKEINQRDLEQHFNLSNPTVTGILNRLELKNFIMRVVDDTDGRFKKIKLCEKALNIEEDLEKIADDLENVLVKNMSESEKSNAFELLEKILKNVSE
ncbi:MarR family winged helix-turn-helix transcriptional regulator [Clostridium chromiireducens]|uniref:MarR family winged helix-turn-helix transcriptional regulator n=1 Tax=Clostridium chromiireducens TaxID=225345 RepID=UPI003AF59F8F